MAKEIKEPTEKVEKKKVVAKAPAADSATAKKAPADAKAAVKEGAPEGTPQTPAAAPGSAVKKSKKVDAGKVYVNASYNNTVITITDMQGNVLAWASAGSLGFSGPKKATPFASSKVIAALVEKTANTGLRDIQIIVKGIGSGRDSAIRSLINHGYNILSIKDATPVPHNGPRPVKTRRV